MSKYKNYKISIEDLKQKTLGNWVVIKELEPIYKNKRYSRILECKCVCGKVKNVLFTHLNLGKSKGCGCTGKYASTHNLSNHPLYHVFTSMKARCYNTKRERYHDWGGRGIKICDEWLNDFQSFYDWSINNNYKKGLQIDRIDNDGNYCPENCRYVTPKVNSQNRRKKCV